MVVPGRASFQWALCLVFTGRSLTVCRGGQERTSDRHTADSTTARVINDDDAKPSVSDPICLVPVRRHWVWICHEAAPNERGCLSWTARSYVIDERRAQVFETARFKKTWLTFFLKRRVGNSWKVFTKSLVLNHSNWVHILRSVVYAATRYKKMNNKNWKKRKENFTIVTLPSVLWRCRLGDRKGVRPVKNWVLAWLSVWSEVQTCSHW